MYFIFPYFQVKRHQYGRAIASSELFYVWCLDIGYICAKSQYDAAIQQKAIELKNRDYFKQCTWFFKKYFKLQIVQYERAVASNESYYVWYHDIGYICAKSQGDAALHQKAIAPRTPAYLKQCTWFFNTFKLKIHQYERVIASSGLYYVWYHDISYICVKFQRLISWY